MRLPKSYGLMLNPTLVLRGIAAILSLVTFIILVIDGHEPFIAADIFVMLILLLDIIMIAHHSVSEVFKVTVELRQQPWSRDLGSQNKPKVATYFDCGFSICLFICLLIGSAVRDRWNRGACDAGVVIGYIVVFLQFLMAVPFLENMTLSIKLYENRGKAPLDTKRPEVFDDTERGSARRRTTEAEAPAQSAEDLV